MDEQRRDDVDWSNDVIQIDASVCSGCGTCGSICPRQVMETVELDGNKITRLVEARQALCIDCGQCAAACAKDAIRVDGLAPEQFQPLEPLALSTETLFKLFERRRSVRRYKDKPVPRELLDRIAEGAGRAPAAAGRANVGVIVVDKPETLREISRHTYELYEGLEKALRNPIARFFIGRQAGKRVRHVLDHFLMPAFREYDAWYRAGIRDEVRRDAPALMLFHTHVLAPEGTVDCLLAAVHAVLTAETLGVGTCVNGFFPPACVRSPGLKALLGLPEDREVQASLTLGFPKFAYKRSIRRKLAELRYLD